VVVSLDIVDKEILDLERGPRIAERGQVWRSFIWVRREKLHRAGSSCVLEALGCEGLVQLCPTMRGLGCVVEWRGRGAWR